MNPTEAVLIAGASGVVGHQLVRLVRQHYPDLPLLLGGRGLPALQQLAQDVGRAQAVQMDVQQPQPLKALRPRAVLALVNDPLDYLLDDALQAGVAYLDITRWTARLKTAAARVSAAPARAPVLLASGWMGGLASTLASLIARDMQWVERVDLSVLYALKDQSGPDSVEYMARLATPFEVLEQGRLITVKPYSDPRRVQFSGGHAARVYRFDTPDQLTLPGTTGASSVSARIAFDDRLTMPLLIGLGRSGLWRLIDGPRFKGLRHALLHNPGDGAPHEVLIQVQGLDGRGQAQVRRLGLCDPQGQTHLTALGALLQLERLLGLDGAPPAAAGLHYPETARALPALLNRLGEQGVRVDEGA
ncbi:MAG: saccharopine dehydrogenase [Pseudomonadota bacterium]